MNPRSLSVLFTTGLAACLCAQDDASPFARLALGSQLATRSPLPHNPELGAAPLRAEPELAYFAREGDAQPNTAASLAAAYAARRTKPEATDDTPFAAPHDAVDAPSDELPAEAMLAQPAPLRSKRGMSYDYADARIVFGDLTGLSVEGSYQFDDNWFGISHLLFGSDDNLDLFSFSGGAGYRYALDVPKGKLDLVATAELEYGSIEVTVGPFKASDSEVGLRLRAGARYQLDDRWEVRAGLGLRTIFDSEVVLDLAGQYNLTDNWSLVVQLDLGSEFTLFGLGARLVF